MFEIEYNERFLKDLKKLKNSKIYFKAKNLCFDELESYENVRQIKNIKKIKGHPLYYRIKLDDYRIGLKIEKNNIIVMRFLHRKEIYKFFP